MTVEELLKKKDIYYRTSGRDFLIKCLNPEHNDSNPSMRIDRILGIYHCLSCGYRGNLFYTFGESFDKGSVQREQLKRKLEDIRTSSIGLRMPKHIQKVDFDYRVYAKTLQEFEAFKSIHRDYEGRITFPIRDLKDRIICFVGRAEAPDITPKYKISPSGVKPPLYPLNKLKPIESKVILVEGIFDMMNLYQYGFTNVLCTFGTNTMSREKLNLLRVLGVSGIDICFDYDDPGQDAAAKIKEMAEEHYFSVRNINLKNVDPGELSKERALKLKDKLYGTA